MPCWYSHALNFPGNPDRSTALSQLSKSNASESDRWCIPHGAIKHLAKALYWFFCDGGDGNASSAETESVVHPSSLQHQWCRLCWFETHPCPLHQLFQPLQYPPTARYWLCGDCLIIHEDPDGRLVLGGFHLGLSALWLRADFTSMFMTKENKITEMVRPVIIPTSILCQPDVTTPEETVILKLVTDEILGSAVYMVFC